MKPFSLPKSERLTHESRIQTLFQAGTSVNSNPLRLVYRIEKPSDTPGVKIMVSVPRKKFKKAVIRNRIKRMMREAYRQNKPEITDISTYCLHIAIIYTGDKHNVIYEEIEKALIAGLKKLALSIDPLK